VYCGKNAIVGFLPVTWPSKWLSWGLGEFGYRLGTADWNRICSRIVTGTQHDCNKELVMSRPLVFRLTAVNPLHSWERVFNRLKNHGVAKMIKRALPILALAVVLASTNLTAHAQSKGDQALLDALVRKGVLTDKEATEISAETANQVMTSPGPKTDARTDLCRR
jgi:hypothetical protein